MAILMNTPQYHNLLKKMTTEQGWRYHPGTFMTITGRGVGGEEWQLKHSSLEDYTYSWKTGCQARGHRAWIGSRAGRMTLFMFSKMRRYRIGPKRFQRRYVTAATDAALLDRLLSQSVIEMLQAWPVPALRRRNLRISLKRDRLRIDTRVNYCEAHIRSIIRLGTTLSRTVSLPNDG